MLLPLLFSLANAVTPITEPCRLSELHVDLPLYIGLSNAIAAKPYGSESVLFATAPSPEFGADEPIEFRFLPSASTSSFSLIVVHHETVALGGSPVTISSISDRLEVDRDGNVYGGHSCEVRLAMANAALERLKEAYGF